ncbi:MAG: GNAT family N-acetyltransferase [Rhodospirillaceae bacterium]|nr:GNAT family N-acetyltransferase [Rhodospirillaceae bacterium]
MKTKLRGGSAVSLRLARDSDSEVLLEWTNILRTDGLSLSGSEPLERGDHKIWFAARLESPDSWIWIIECASVPVGMVRLEREPGKATDRVEVSVFITQESRGMGLASTAIECALKHAALKHGISRAIARVRHGNIASRRLFEGLGFTTGERRTDHIALRRRASRSTGGHAYMKLGLGTVQFGMPYGITNSAGIPSPSSVSQILDIARDGNVDLVDTAACYGDSERILGDLLPDGWKPKLVTKTMPLGDNPITQEALAGLRENVLRSIKRLGRQPIYALLVHHGTDVLKRNGDQLIGMLQRLKEEGSVENIGVSVYGGAELDAILLRFLPDIVQLPYSLCDQRLHDSGQLKKLRHSGVEIHARSIFLQGTLLTTPECLPSYFAPLRVMLNRLAADYGDCPTTRVAVCLKAVMLAPEIDVAIVGVTEPRQLRTILDAMQLASEISLDRTQFRIDHSAILDPSTWPSRASLVTGTAHDG